MNIEEYIASGKLEDYALGILTAAEASEVEDYVARYPQLAAELRRIEEALELYAGSAAKTPPPGLEHQIWQSIQKQDLPAGSEKPLSTASRQPAPGPKMLSIRPWLAAASVLLLMISTALSFYFYNQWAASESALFAVLQEKEHLAGNLEAQQASYKKMQDELAIVSNPATHTVVLQGVAEFPHAQAMVFWQQQSANVYLKIHSLPPPPQNKQYQLWAFVDGKPVDAGVFDMPGDNSAMLKMKDFSRATAFAITLEDRGGKPAPEGAVYAMGNI